MVRKTMVSEVNATEATSREKKGWNLLEQAVIIRLLTRRRGILRLGCQCRSPCRNCVKRITASPDQVGQAEAVCAQAGCLLWAAGTA